MQKMAVPILSVALISLAYAQGRPAVVEALDGVDPVLLVQGKEVSGKPELKVVRGGFEYSFVSADTKAAFEKEPAKYEIQLNGLCARMGKATGGRPSDFVVHEGRTYIFGSDECHKKFAADPAKYLPPAPVPMPASSRAAADGRALLERTVAAIGGAARVDPMATYVETSSRIQKRPTGDVPVTIRTMWRFPGTVRMERTATVQGNAMSSATLMTPAGMWFLSQGRAFPAIEAGRPSMELDFGRQIVPLLHARGDAGFKAVALGPGTVAGHAVERVRIVNGGVDVTLGLDPSSRRIHSVTFVDRHTAEGHYGEYTAIYTDYRPVAGLMLPFSERVSFNGVPAEFLTRTLDAIAINPPLEPTLFEPGMAGGQ
jgi:YHS domain-containing protein